MAFINECSPAVDASTAHWKPEQVYRASKLCDLLQIKPQSILGKTTLYRSLDVSTFGDASRALSTVIENWIVFHQIAIATHNAQLEADLQILLTHEYKSSNTLQYKIAGIYYQFAKITKNNGCLDSTRDFLLENLGWSVAPYQMAPPLQYTFHLSYSI